MPNKKKRSKKAPDYPADPKDRQDMKEAVGKVQKALRLKDRRAAMGFLITEEFS